VGVEGGTGKERIQVKGERRAPTGPKEIFVEVKEDLLLTNVAKDGYTVVSELMNIIALEPNGSTLVVVGSVFVTQNAMPRLASLSPIGGTLRSKICKGGSDEPSEERLGRIKQATLLK